MTTTQYTPGTIILHEDEAHRILRSILGNYFVMFVFTSQS